MTDFYGFPVLSVSNGLLRLDCLATAGPRIVRLHFKGSSNLLAEVPHIAVPTVFGDFHYLGGHRLWHAPEALPRSYVPDDAGLESAEQMSSGMVLRGRVESGTGIRKRIELRLDPDKPRVQLIHTLTNEGAWQATLSPWAITMFSLGGTAILPTRIGQGNEADLLPDRHFSLWPYSHIEDPRLALHDEFVAVHALAGQPLFKIGTFNSAGWIVYALGDVLFRKSFAVQPGVPYPDHDCNAEVYCDDQFIELESLGPLTALEPGGSISHEEIWEIYDSTEQAFLSDPMRLAIAGSAG